MQVIISNQDCLDGKSLAGTFIHKTQHLIEDRGFCSVKPETEVKSIYLDYEQYHKSCFGAASVDTLGLFSIACALLSTTYSLEPNTYDLLNKSPSGLVARVSVREQEGRGFES